MDISNDIINILSEYPTSINTIEAEKVGEFLLPFSVGIEIECDKQFTFNDAYFTHIPNILDVETDNCEQRYRIPTGLKGLQCLYDICHNLKLYSILNRGSGIHYHIDFTKEYSLVTDNFIKENSDYILNELDKWNYDGTYNKRQVLRNTMGWVRVSDEHKTFEFRVGEMSFEYKVLYKRIIHLMEICKTLKLKLIKNTNNITNYSKIKDIINNRKINLYD